MDLTARQPIEFVRKERELIDSLQHFVGIFNSISTVTVVLNSNRQIIFASNDFLKLLELTSDASIVGTRPGEAIACVHSQESPHGCNHSSSCSLCGLFQAVIESGKANKKVTKETRLTTTKNDNIISLDLSVTSVPIELAGSQFYMVTMTDISSEKRKMQLEQIFIHDLVNSAGGISGLSDVLEYAQNEEKKKQVIDVIGKTSKVLLEQILSFRHIISAESGELEVVNSEFDTNFVIDEAIHIVTNNKSLMATFKKDVSSDSVLLVSDKVLLSRILVNMLKNAAEAENNSDSVILIGAIQEQGHIKFWVKNNNVIPGNTQKQIFQRSFSTKGSNRGLGTYSMKLLGENYLKGKVGFVSNEVDRTIFYVELPS